MNLGWWAWLLLVIGGLNLGLDAVAGYNVIEELLGSGSTAVQVVYVLIGLGAVYSIAKRAQH